MKNQLQNIACLIVCVVTLIIPSLLSAQDTTDTGRLKTVVLTHASGFKTTSVRLGGGMGYGMYRDLGTAPMRFKGLMIQPSVGIEWSGMRKWTTTIDNNSTVGVFEDAVEPKLNFGSFDISNTLRFKMRKHISSVWSLEEESKLHLGHEDKHSIDPKKHYVSFSAGFGAANFIDITVNPEYENASTGISEFFGPELMLRADLFLNTIFDWWNYDKADKQIHTEIGFMPLAAVMRPGYAYIDNYTASQPVLAALFDQYEWHLKPFAGLYTDIGVDFISTFSRVSISYIWSYYSSGNGGASRFDHASHLFAIDFIIPIKTKRACISKITPVD